VAANGCRLAGFVAALSAAACSDLFLTRPYERFHDLPSDRHRDHAAAADLYDWLAVTARLATQAPQWEPGTAAGYHSVTQGFLVGRGRPPDHWPQRGRVLRRRRGRPLGADFHMGLPAEHDHRAALCPT
jgi:hypothetical protein